MPFKFGPALWVAVILAEDGDEAMVMWPAADGLRPVIASDEIALADIRRLAAHMARELGQRVRIMRFSGPADEVETYEP